MQALQLTAWKSPPEQREVPDPEPAAGQVLLRVTAAGACHSDVALFDEFEADPGMLAPPFVLGHETSGWVEALGPGVRGLEIGSPHPNPVESPICGKRLYGDITITL